MAHPYLAATGLLLILIGVLLWRWSSRHDLKGMALDAAWQVAKNRRLDVETDLGNRLKDLRSEGSNTRRAKLVAGHAVRHLLAPAVNITALVCLAAGMIMIGYALWSG